MFKISRIGSFILAAAFSSSVFAMEPNKLISPEDVDYAKYSAVINIDQKLVNEGYIADYNDINEFNIAGRVVPVADGTRLNPYNLVLSVNGNLYYVDAILTSVESIKIRRRWRDNPEPGIFLRIQGRRTNPEDGRVVAAVLWVKVATPEGRAIPELKVLEGNYDLAELPPPEPLMPKVAGYLPGNPGPILPPPGFERANYLPGNPGPILPPPFQRASELMNDLVGDQSL